MQSAPTSEPCTATTLSTHCQVPLSEGRQPTCRLFSWEQSGLVGAHWSFKGADKGPQRGREPTPEAGRLLRPEVMEKPDFLLQHMPEASRTGRQSAPDVTPALQPTGGSGSPSTSAPSLPTTLNAANCPSGRPLMPPPSPRQPPSGTHSEGGPCPLLGPR